MTPTTPLVPIRARSPPVPLSTQQHLFDSLQTGHHFLSKRGKDNIGARTVNLDRLSCAGGWRRKEVVNVLVVDFEVGAAKKVFACWGLADVPEDIFHGSGYNTGLVFFTGLHIHETFVYLPMRAFTHQCEGFTTGRLTVSKYDGVVAIHGRAYVTTRNRVVYRFVL